MIDPNISDDEKKCLRILAKLFQEGRAVLWSGSLLSMLNLHDVGERLRSEGLELSNPAAYAVMIRVMAGYGAIEEAKSEPVILFGAEPGSARRDTTTTIISAAVVQMARELDELEKRPEEPEDIVEQLRTSAKANPYIARAVFWFGIITAIAVFIAAVLTIIDKAIDLQKKLGG